MLHFLRQALDGVQRQRFHPALKVSLQGANLLHGSHEILLHESHGGADPFELGEGGQVDLQRRERVRCLGFASANLWPQRAPLLLWRQLRVQLQQPLLLEGTSPLDPFHRS